MRRALTIILGTLAIIALVLISAVSVGRWTFNRSVARDVDSMFDRIAGQEAEIVTEAEIAHLPEPVQRWLEWSGVVGRERPLSVRLRQEGEIRMNRDAGWMPFTAEQYYITDPPSFVWHVDARMMPLISFAGRDRYLDGHGNMDIRVLSLIPVVNETGEHMDQGTLVRYLNEIMWFPAGAISPHITWEAIDDDPDAARATMTYGGMTVEATFYFDEAGRVVNMMAPRYQDSGGEITWLPWWTPVHEYGEFDGMNLPVAGEAYWEEESGNFTYVRLRLIDVEYNVPERY